MINQKQLIELGFTSKEARVYLALLELGPSTTAQIARMARINRTTGYDILETLAGNGLVNLVGETKVQKYAAENPAKVLKYLENKINEAKQQLNSARSLLPQLLSIYSTKEKPKVKFYEGIEGMQEAFEDTLSAKNEIIGYAVGEDIFKALTEKYVRNYFKRRIQKNISARFIAPDTPETRAVAINDAAERRTTIMVPKEKFYFSMEMDIYNNKIMMASWREKFAIIIESEEITNAQRKIFELAWQGAKVMQVK